MVQFLRALLRPGRYTRPGLFRREWHRWLGHKVVGTVVQDAKAIRGNRLSFFYRKGWVCLDCGTSWP